MAYVHRGPIHETLSLSGRTGRPAKEEAMSNDRNVWGAAVVLAIHSAMGGHLMDAQGEDAPDTPAMAALWDEARRLCPDRRVWGAAHDLSMAVFG